MESKKKFLLLGFLVFIFAIFIMPKTVSASDQFYIATSSIASYTGEEVELSYIDVYVFEKTSTDSASYSRVYLTEGTDYKITYSNNVNMGENTAKAKIVGLGDYADYPSKTITFSIYGFLSNSNFTTVSSIKDREYTGIKIKPTPTVYFNGKKLTKGTDYTVSYDYSNLDIGKGYITITGTGLYYGVKVVTFNIIPAKVENVKTTQKSNGVQLSWTKDSNVTGYYIYRSTKSGSGYKRIATVTSNSTTTYLDKTATSGTKYYYKIKSYYYDSSAYKTYQGKIDSASAVKGYYLSTPSVSIICYTDKATLSWKKVTNADGYQIYRATSKDGEYTRIKTITSGSTLKYTDSSIKSKKQYYYKIRAYVEIDGKKVYSSYSSKIEKTPYAQVTISSATKTSSTKIKLTWKKVSGVTGYEIYRATSVDSTYVKVKTIKGASNLTYTDTDITAGVAYTYKVRVYVTSGSSKLYGQKSSAKKVVTGTIKQQINNLVLEPDEEFVLEYSDKIASITKGKKSQFEQLKACYKYVLTHMSHAEGYSCVNYAAAFAGYARALGFDAQEYNGTVATGSGSFTAHTWVQININGTEYLFDASIDDLLADSAGKTESYTRFAVKFSSFKAKYNTYYGGFVPYSFTNI